MLDTLDKWFFIESRCPLVLRIAFPNCFSQGGGFPGRPVVPCIFAQRSQENQHKQDGRHPDTY